MESVAVKNHQISHSNILPKPLDSSIKIDSISIDLNSPIEKIAIEECEHFSIRGYVSEIRKRDWKRCWPFVSDCDGNNYEKQTCVLPPLHVPKFRFWRCQNCVWEIGANGTENSCGTAHRSCSTGFKNSIHSHAPILDNAAMLPSDVREATNPDILKGRQVNANDSVNLSGTARCHRNLLCINKNEKKSEDINGPFTGKSNHSEDNSKQEIHRLTFTATEVFSSPIQKTPHTDDIAAFKSKSNDLCKPSCGHKEVTDAPLAGNFNCKVDNVTKICERGKETSVDDQQRELIICGTSGDAGNVDDEALGADKDPLSRCPSLELDEQDDPSSESADIIIGNSSQDGHENSSGLRRRKTRKVRLLTELLCENGDGDTDNTGTGNSLPNSIPDASAGVDKTPVLQGEVAVQGKRRGLCQSKKRKLHQDEDTRPLDVDSPNKVPKEAGILKRDVETVDAVMGSESEEDALARMGLQAGMKIQWAKNKSDGSPIVGKKKNKKALTFDECPSSEPPRENMPNEIWDKIGDNSKANVVDSVLTKSAQSASTCREMDLFPLPAERMEENGSDCKKKGKMPQVVDCHVSLSPWNVGFLREGPMARKDEGTMHARPVVLPFHSAQDAYMEKGLDLSLNSYRPTQEYIEKHIPQVENRKSSLLCWQEGTSKDQVLRKAAETRLLRNLNFTSTTATDAHFERGLHGDLSSNSTTFKIPFLNEKQKYSSQVEIGGSLMQKKDFGITNNNEQTTGIQEHSAFARKDIDQRADKLSEQGALDDIPMEIVELMAKNQYERCLPDGEHEKCQLETSKNMGGRTSDFSKVHRHRGLSLFPQETTQKQNSQARKNGVIKIVETVGPTKQKSVEFVSQANRNPFGMSQMELTRTSAGFEPFLQHQEKQCSGVQHPASSSNRQNIAQHCKRTEDVVGKRSFYTSFQVPGPCNTCQSIPQQSKEGNQRWAAMMQNHMPFPYGISPNPKCIAPSTNVDVFSHSSRSMIRDHANLGKQNMKFGSESHISAHPEYPFARKNNGIELNQKPMGSLDLYSNETIPAMHLLSLMDAGLQSSATIKMDVNPKFVKRPPVAQNPESKEFSRLDTGSFNHVNTIKHPPSNYHGKNQLAENFRDHIPAIQTNFGASASSIQQDKSFKKASNVSSQVHQVKEKRKGPDSRTQNKVTSSQRSAHGGFGSSCGSIPVHSMQTLFFGARDSTMFPFSIPTLENPNKHKLESRTTNRTIHTHKSSSETETCVVNRNPADFSVPEAGNVYMIAGEDLKFVKEVPFVNGAGAGKSDGHKRQRKHPPMKDHGRPLIS